jgi:hypothetical protein
VNYARRILSLTGNSDPVGGSSLEIAARVGLHEDSGDRLIVEEQNIVGLDSETDLATLIENALTSNQSWAVQAKNPHDWVQYVQNNANRLRQWMLG